MKPDTLIVCGLLAICAAIVGGQVAGRDVGTLGDLAAQVTVGLLGYLSRGFTDKTKEQGE